MFGVGNDNPLQYSCLENSVDRWAWWYSPWGHKELDTTEHIHTRIGFRKTQKIQGRIKSKLNQLSRNNILHYIHMHILYMSVYILKCFLFFISFYWSIIALQCCYFFFFKELLSFKNLYLFIYFWWSWVFVTMSDFL